MANKNNKNGALIALVAVSAATVASGCAIFMNVKKNVKKSKKTVRLISPDNKKIVTVDSGNFSTAGEVTGVKISAQSPESKCTRVFFSKSVKEDWLFVWRDNDNLTIHFSNTEGEKIASVCFNEGVGAHITFADMKNDGSMSIHGGSLTKI